MSNFQDRLKLQKYIYLLQAFGLYLGFRFNWYIYGPYSPDLARDGFELAKQYPNVPEVKFMEEKDETKFSEFIGFLHPNEDNTDWLEMIASLHFLKKMYPGRSKGEIFEKVRNKQPYLNDEQKCEACWEYLKTYKLI
ncbi:MAG: hypothetical protein A2Z27_05950 [candidate division Zixibacteria bacterium RBG_16_50_21]|nr:MAG: hypothetical protein A2Z27_05950 [candidate division Zixibacteria bacterium RBG_16_50_21]